MSDIGRNKGGRLSNILLNKCKYRSRQFIQKNLNKHE